MPSENAEPIRPARREHLTALTSLRFFAAILVVVYHGCSELSELPGGLSGIIRNGFMGVSLFFILSGFVLTYTYRGANASLKDFFAARFARIYPVYLFSLLFAAPLFFKGFITEHGAEKIGPLLLGKLTLIQAWVPWMMHNWNVPSWSLSSEAFFYLCFPLLMPIFGRVPAAFRLPAIVALITAYGFGQPLSDLPAPDYSFSPIRDLALFGAGILIGHAFCDGWRAPKWLLPVTLIAGVAAMIVYEPIPGNGLIKVAFTLMLCGWIGGIASIKPTTSSWMNNPTLKLLGESSYALYILHLPIADVFAFAGSKLGFSFKDAWILAIYIPVSVIASVWAFKLIEAPANKWLRKRLSKRTRAVTSLQT